MGGVTTSCTLYGVYVSDDLYGFDLVVQTLGTGTGTVTSSPAGISCGSTCTTNFATGAVVTLTPSASAGSTFAGWSGACAGVSTCIVTMNAAKSVTATFNSIFDANVRSVVTGYYQTILGRSPDQGGLDFWASEATRVVGLGAVVREVFFAMSISFFGSPEYLNKATSDTQYLTDLYRTFFVTFGRLPDSAGFAFWLGEIRKAQCQGAAQVSAAVNTLAGSFFNSAEYAGRARNNRDFVGDVYNAYMRRGPGGDAAGYNFWVGQVPVLERDGLRGQFIPSPELQNRVTAVVNAGCLP